MVALEEDAVIQSDAVPAQIDLVVLACRVPHRRHGLGLAERVRARGVGARVVRPVVRELEEVDLAEEVGAPREERVLDGPVREPRSA